MLLTLICLAICLVLGYIICNFFLKDNIAFADLLAVSIILGLVIMSYSVLFLALIFKDMETAVSVFLGTGGMISAAYLWLALPKLKRITLSSFKKIDWFGIIFVILIILVFLDLFTKTLIYENSSFLVASEGFGDIPFHMNQVSYFIYNHPFGLENPIYSGASLAYHFIINFLSAAFFFLSKNYILSFQLPPIILGSASIFLLYSIISKIIRGKMARISAFLIFFLGTNIGFFKVLADKNVFAKKGLNNLLNYLLHLPYPIGLYFSATHPEQNTLWSTFLTMCFMHQRAFIFGLAVVLACLLILYSLSQKTDKKVFYLLGIIVGFLPLIQAYSFLAVLIIISSFFLAALLFKKRDLFLGLLKSITLSVIISLPSLFFLFSVKKENNIRFRLGWMMDSFAGINFNPERTSHFPEWLSFIWQNSGLLIPVFVIAIVYLILAKKIYKQGGIFPLSLIFSALAFWIVLNTIQFQRWDFDNYKIYGYFLLSAALVIGFFFDQLKLWLKIVPILLITIFLTLSGFIIVLSHSSFAAPSLYSIFDKDSLTVAKWVVEKTFSTDIVLTAPTSVNPMSSLAGRPVLLGDFMWIWTHGLDWTTREADIQIMYQGNEQSKDLFEKYKIVYVLIGDQERNNFEASEDFFYANYPLVFQLGDTKIYRVLGR